MMYSMIVILECKGFTLETLLAGMGVMQPRGSSPLSETCDPAVWLPQRKPMKGWFESLVIYEVVHNSPWRGWVVRVPHRIMYGYGVL